MSYRIRHLETDDFPALLRMGYEFFEAAGLPGTFSPTAFAEFWSDTIGGGVGFVLVLEFQGEEGDPVAVGTIGGILYPDPCTGDRCAQETFWWVDEEFRGRRSADLIDAFEILAWNKGANRIMMSALHGMNHRALEKFYGGRGYRPLEFSFVKEA